MSLRARKKVFVLGASGMAGMLLLDFFQSKDMMYQALNNDLSGVYHLVNNASVSKYELIKLFNTYLNNSKTEMGENADTVSNKVLKNTRSDFSFTVPYYEEMVKEISEWVNAHKELYPHYFNDKEVKENV